MLENSRVMNPEAETRAFLIPAQGMCGHLGKDMRDSDGFTRPVFSPLSFPKLYALTRPFRKQENMHRTPSNSSELCSGGGMARADGQ